jgi:hypothetical protein
MAIKQLLGLVFAAVLAGGTLADEVKLNPDHPDRYVVVKGDTLWDISGRFLEEPWLWPEVWYVNPQIENPHLIYPGDVITLVYVDGKPQLRVQRGRPTVKLSPKAREQRLDQAIHTIPIDAIKQFLTQPLVMGPDELQDSAYIVSAADEHVVVGAGDRIYVRGNVNQAYTRYNIFRPGDPYVDPDTGEILGYAADYVGDATVERFDEEVTTMKVVRTSREARMGDRLLPVTQEEIHAHFIPHAPATEVDGRIISVVDGVTQIGQFQVVVLNRGTREGIEVGHALAVYQAGERMRDMVSGKPDDWVQLPDERGGELMVFRVFDKVSFGLILEASRALHLMDKVRNP